MVRQKVPTRRAAQWKTKCVHIRCAVLPYDKCSLVLDRLYMSLTSVDTAWVKNHNHKQANARFRVHDVHMRVKNIRRPLPPPPLPTMFRARVCRLFTDHRDTHIWYVFDGRETIRRRHARCLGANGRPGCVACIESYYCLAFSQRRRMRASRVQPMCMGKTTRKALNECVTRFARAVGENEFRKHRRRDTRGKRKNVADDCLVRVREAHITFAR